MTRIPALLLLLSILACSAAPEPTGREPADARERIDASAELATLGIASYAFHDDGTARVDLFRADGALATTVFLDGSEDQLYAEAVVDGSTYVVQADGMQYAFLRDGKSLASVDVEAALDGAELPKVPADAEFGFQLISAASVVLSDHVRGRSGHVPVDDLQSPLDPVEGFCYGSTGKSSTLTSASVWGWGMTKTRVCEEAKDAVNNACSNDYCLGCKEYAGCDAACIVGDWYCISALAYGYACTCPNGGGGGNDGGEGGGDDGSSPGSGANNGYCYSDWDCNLLDCCDLGECLPMACC